MVGAAGSSGLAHQAVFGVIQMLGVLLDGAVIRLVAMNQAAKAVIFIVYRLPGGHVKLFRQIAFSITKSWYLAAPSQDSSVARPSVP